MPQLQYILIILSSVLISASFSSHIFVINRDEIDDNPSPSPSPPVDQIIIEETNSVCNISESLRLEIASYQPVVNRIIEALTSPDQLQGRTWNELSKFVDTFGPRMAGSESLENAIDYMLQKFQDVGLENVHAEEAEVTHWVRGNESATLLSPRNHSMSILGLGSSIGTPPEGITADVVVVRNFDELQLRAQEASGKIVVYNPEYVDYGTTVVYRTNGAVEAAKVGAVASLVRSVTPFSIYSPHTGHQAYQDNVTQIPTACITIEDAEMLHRMYHRGEKLTINLKMDAENLPNVMSRNTIGELPGTTHPQEIVIISGHLDSWDVGQGAMDDGGGAFIAWMSLVVMKHLNLTTRRTMRTILWTAEEQGYLGAEAYFHSHLDEIPLINYMMESDEGTFKPTGVSFSGTDEAGCIIQEILKLLEPLNATLYASPQDGGPDISVWTDIGVPGSSLLNENDDYYWFHHSNGDTMTVEDSGNLDLCTAVWTIVSYVVADLSIALPKQLTLEGIDAETHTNEIPY